MSLKNSSELNGKISIFDRKRELIFPKKMTDDLAEFMGIMTGDGHISYHKYGRRTNYTITVTGNSETDLKYFEQRILPLFKKLFNLDLKISKRKNEKTISVQTRSVGIYNFLLNMGLKSAPKDRIEIPRNVLNNGMIIHFIRGLFDTDGGLCLKKRYRDYHYYPVISLKQKSKIIITQVERILKDLGFSFYSEYDVVTNDKRGFTSKGSRIYLYGMKNLEKWLDIIGFNNPKYTDKASHCLKLYGNGGI
ncbi:MAG: hypothetical protein KAS04_02380 [Candidatus Aenigmarchaeota archaeon]|nr:hypothetical protein [Candidatus Aenigmarchaeota archaeon]